MNFDPKNITPIKLGSSYCYYLPSSHGGILVDAGNHQKQNQLQSVLLAHEYDIRDIRYIILTHTHHDHVGSLAEIKKISGAKVFVHKDEAEFLKNGRTPLPKGTLPWTKTMVRIGKIIRIGSYPAVMPDFIITDQLELNEFDFDLTIVSTPGHTSGSMTIIIDKKYAFVGDTMFNIRHDTVFPPFANDESALLSSWNTLLATPCELFFPGHGRPIERDKLERSYVKALHKAKK
jgi:glyoxylase-like metal-dependent hydrolase (beta-lactamase superfamily II)